MDLFDARGRRLYCSAEERQAFRRAADLAPGPTRTLCLVLYYTGCRLSEALELTPARVDRAGQTVVFRTLKTRRRTRYRAVPVPAPLLEVLARVHQLPSGFGAGSPAAARLLWPWSRTTAWRRVKAVMDAAGIADGPQRSPKGLRHGFAVHALGVGVPLNMLSKWLGHARLETTALYANALGAEQLQMASRMWQDDPWSSLPSYTLG